jgi:hypothetical protein
MTKIIVTDVVRDYQGGLHIFYPPGQYATARQLPDGQWELRQKRDVFGNVLFPRHPLAVRRMSYLARLGIQEPVSRLAPK